MDRKGGGSAPLRSLLERGANVAQVSTPRNRMAGASPRGFTHQSTFRIESASQPIAVSQSTLSTDLDKENQVPWITSNIRDSIAQKFRPATPTLDLNPKVERDPFWDSSDGESSDGEALLTSSGTGAGLLTSADTEPDVAVYPAYPARVAVFAELGRLLRMALPLLGVNALYSSQGIISMAFLGHLGRRELAGGALAISLGNICGDR